MSEEKLNDKQLDQEQLDQAAGGLGGPVSGPEKDGSWGDSPKKPGTTIPSIKDDLSSYK